LKTRREPITLVIEEKGIRRSVRFVEIWPARPWPGLRFVYVLDGYAPQPAMRSPNA
jgi:hypothetical protein